MTGDEPVAAPGGEPARGLVRLHMPVDVRSASLAVLAALASLWALRWAGAVFVPLLMGLLCSYALSPLVDRLQRWHLPRAFGAAVLLVGGLAGIGALAYSLADDTAALIESLPDAAQKLRHSMHSARSAPESPIDKVQRAAANLELAAAEHGAATIAGKGVTRVQIEPTHFNVKDYLWSGTLGLAGAVGQALVVGFITYFLLVSGDSFRRKMAHIAGPRFSQKRLTVQALDEITVQIRRYLVVQLQTSLLVGLATGAACLWLGLDRAIVWGVAAALLNLVPYIGALLTSAALALVALLQFGTPGMALLIGGVSLAIHAVSGNLVTPWLTGRASRMNPLVIFVGVLAWGWLWGVWGLLLGAPLLMAVKAVCDRVDDLKPIGELLGA